MVNNIIYQKKVIFLIIMDDYNFQLVLARLKKIENINDQNEIKTEIKRFIKFIEFEIFVEKYKNKNK